MPPPSRRPSDEPTRTPRSLDVGRFVVDLVILGGAGAVTASSAHRSAWFISLVVVFALVALGLMAAWRGYTTRLRLDALDDVRLVVTSTSVAVMLVISVDTLVSTNEPSAREWVRLWVIATIGLALARIASTYAVRRSRVHGRVGAPTLIIGAGHVGRLTATRLMSHPEFGLRPVGFIDKEPIDIRGEPLPVPVLGASWDLEQAVEDHGIEWIVITFSSAPHDVVLGVLDECSRLGVRCLVVPRLFERTPSRLEVTHTGALPLIEMHPSNPRSVQYALKYAIDRVAAAALLVLLSPLLLIVSLAVLLSLGRPVLYRQRRVGLDGREFEMLKFRTMLPAEGEDEPELEFAVDRGPGGVEGDDRRTWVGTQLRRFSLDELAQIFNVLKGEMSLVGPRPERPEFVEYFAAHVRRYDARHRVKSGITGWAQIHRLRGKTSIGDRVEWDNYYIENFSLWLDLKIVLLTIPELFRGGSE